MAQSLKSENPEKRMNKPGRIAPLFAVQRAWK
jgi:hypothetical protein